MSYVRFRSRELEALEHSLLTLKLKTDPKSLAEVQRIEGLLADDDKVAAAEYAEAQALAHREGYCL